MYILFAILVVTLVDFIVIGIPSCNKKICLSWYENENQFVLICHVPDLHRHIIFHNPLRPNDEYAFCAMPFPRPHCFSRHNTSIIAQDLTTNQTTLTIENQYNNALNGNWSCRHGSNEDHTSVAINLTQTVSDVNWQKSSVLLKGSFDADRLTLICKIDQLSSEVDIINPQGDIAGLCLSPQRHQRFGFCTRNTKQYITSNVTVLTLSLDSIQVGGSWTCLHVEDGENDTIHILVPNSLRSTERPEQINRCHILITQVVINVLFVVVFLVIAKLLCRKMNYKSSSRRLKEKLIENQCHAEPIELTIF